MRLFYMPGACSLAPHIAAVEAGLKFTLDKVDTKAGRTERGEDFKKINPKGYVPAIQLDSGQVLTEAAVCTLYLADQAPANRLVPRDGMARYRALEWLNYVATEVHKGMGALFNKSAPEATREANREAILKKLGFLDHHLSSSDFALGHDFSAVDAYLFTTLNWHKWLNLDIGSYPSVVGYLNRVGARESVRAALKAEGLG